MTAAARRAHNEMAEALMAEIAMDCKDAAVIAHCSPSHIRRALQVGDLKGTRIGRLWRITPEAVRQWLTKPMPITQQPMVWSRRLTAPAIEKKAR